MKPKHSNSPTGGSSASPSPERISELAHTLWLQEGKPEGRDLHHWLEAERQLWAGGVRTRPPSASVGKSAELGKREIESDKRLDGLAPARRDPRTPKGEAL